MTTIYIVTTGSVQTQAKPGDWSATNSFEVVGGGGGGSGGTSVNNQASGAGGGAYAKSVNITVSGGVTNFYASVGIAGTSGAIDGNGGDGGDSWLRWDSTSTPAAPTLTSQGVLAKGGGGAHTNTIGAGGAAGSSLGTTKTSSGGAGGQAANTFYGGAGGGGAGGLQGAGGPGGNDGITADGGSGGGGSGGGGSGTVGGTGVVDQASGSGGNGGNNAAGTGTVGTGATAGASPAAGGTGTLGAGGGGGAHATSGASSKGGDGGPGQDWDSTHGVGGGGGGGGGSAGANNGGVGGTGGLYGGGGGAGGSAGGATAGVGGAGGQGIAVIIYTSSGGGTNFGWWNRATDERRLLPEVLRSYQSPYFAQSPSPVPTVCLPRTNQWDQQPRLPKDSDKYVASSWFRPSPNPVPATWLPQPYDQSPFPTKSDQYVASWNPQTFVAQSTIAGIAWHISKEEMRSPPTKLSTYQAPYFAQSPNPVPILWPPKTGENRERDPAAARRPDEPPGPWFVRSPSPVLGTWLPLAGEHERLPPGRGNPDPAKPFFQRSPNPVPTTWLPTAGETEKVVPVRLRTYRSPYFTRSPNPVPTQWLPVSGEDTDRLIRVPVQYYVTWQPQVPSAQVNTIAGMVWYISKEELRPPKPPLNPDQFQQWFVRSSAPVPIRWLPQPYDQSPFPAKSDREKAAFTWSPKAIQPTVALPITGADVEHIVPVRENRDPAKQWFLRSLSPVPTSLAWWKAADESRITPGRIRSPDDEAKPFFRRIVPPVLISGMAWWKQADESRLPPKRQLDENFRWFFKITQVFPPQPQGFPPLVENLTKNMLAKDDPWQVFHTDSAQVLTQVNDPHEEYQVVGWTPVGGTAAPIGNAYNLGVKYTRFAPTGWWRAPDQVGSWPTAQENLSNNMLELGPQAQQENLEFWIDDSGTSLWVDDTGETLFVDDTGFGGGSSLSIFVSGDFSPIDFSSDFNIGSNENLIFFDINFFIDPIDYQINDPQQQYYPIGLMPLGLDTTPRALIGVEPYAQQGPRIFTLDSSLLGGPDVLE